MPPCDFVPKPYKGMSYEKTRDIRKNNLSPALLTYYKNPILITQGHKQWLFDHEGKRYLDMFAGIVTVGLGHCHPKINAVLKEQSETLWHTTSIYMHPKIHEYAEKLAAKMPGNLKVIYFVNSGSEANDMATFMARSFTGNYDIISFMNAYHGVSPTTMGLTAIGKWKHGVPHSFGFHHAMNPDVYRGIWGGSNCRDSPVQTTRKCSCGEGQCQASDNYINQFEEVLNYCVPKTGLAGFFAESIQGVGGAMQYPKGYLKKAFELVRSRGGICISDEVQSGFGRTGEHFWGFEMHGVVPDIVTMAKSMGNGFPIAAVITTPEIAKSMTKALYINTFGGNALGCAIGSAVLDAIEEEKLQQNARTIGTYMIKKLENLRQKYSVIGDVRGKGLMLGVELVTDQESHKPMAAADFQEIFENLREMGVLIGSGGLHGNVFRIAPPMIITQQDVDFFLETFENAIKNHIERKK